MPGASPRSQLIRILAEMLVEDALARPDETDRAIISDPKPISQPSHARRHLRPVQHRPTEANVD